jgi:hypothetical protein
VSKYQPPQLTETDVEMLWQRACEEMKEIAQPELGAFGILRKHAVDVSRLATDHGMEIQWTPIGQYARIVPIGSPRIVMSQGGAYPEGGWPK